jgi:hypothetical protein
MNKKGISSTTFYFPLILIISLIIVIAFVILPAATMNKIIQVSSIDSLIMRERVKNLVSFDDPLSLRSYPLSLDKKEDFVFNLSNDFIFSDRKNVAYRLFFDGKESFYAKDLFFVQNSKIPLGEYNKFVFDRELSCSEDKCGRFVFEQILPKVYYVK